MQDDALNCHGTHLRIIGKPAENQLLMRFMHKQTYGFAAYQAGDEIAVISKDNLREYDGNPRRKVTAIERVNDKEWLLTLNGPAPEFKKDDVVDNITWYPDLTATNNHVSMDPVRGFLITTRGKVLVENNTFHRPAMAGILIENDASGWFESGPIRDMLIRNNRFVRCGISINPHTRSDKPEEPVHENIRIENNQFSEGGGISARNVKGLTIRQNQSPDGPVQIKLKACTDVIDQDSAGHRRDDGQPAIQPGRMGEHGDRHAIFPARIGIHFPQSRFQPLAGNRSLDTEAYLVRGMAESSLLPKVSRCESSRLPFGAYW